MWIKPGVKLDNLQPQCVIALLAAYDTFRILGAKLTLTSGSDGKHSSGSLHYQGRAIDLRTRDLTQVEKEQATREISARLGADFDVVLESDHIHVEYDPK